LVFHSSTITMMHVPINIRFTMTTLGPLSQYHDSSTSYEFRHQSQIPYGYKHENWRNL